MPSNKPNGAGHRSNGAGPPAVPWTGNAPAGAPKPAPQPADDTLGGLPLGWLREVVRGLFVAAGRPRHYDRLLPPERNALVAAVALYVLLRDKGGEKPRAGEEDDAAVETARALFAEHRLDPAAIPPAPEG